MNDDVELAEIYDQEIDEQRLAQILFDIDAAAELLDVNIKAGSRTHASVGKPDLSAAKAALDAGALGIQLRYRFEGKEWWDTIMRSASGRLRIVRTEVPTF